MKAKFSVGQRVIARHALHPANEGYYGHVVRAFEPDPETNSLIEPVYDVALTGRAGKAAMKWMLSGSVHPASHEYDPYPFYESELDAAD